MKNKSLKLFLKQGLRVLLLAFSILSASMAFAYNFMVDGIYYNINGNEATVTYETTSYNSYRGSVTIPSTITYNGVTYYVTSIGSSAFKYCTGLTSVTIPESVTSIGVDAFRGCTGITSVSIPNSVKTIGNSAFSGCSGLPSIIIPNSVTSIGYSAFKNCSSLTGVYISDLEAWFKIYFSYNSNDYDYQRDYSANPLNCAHHLYLNGIEVTELIIPSTVTSINSLAFCGCKGLTNVTIHNDVTSIGYNAFIGCSALETLNFNAVSCADFHYSGENAYYGKYPPFYNLNIKTINIGDSVVKLPAFFAYRLTELTSVTIGNSVTSIGGDAFNECTGITCVTIPESVKSIGNSAFSGCSSLVSISIPSSVGLIGESVFNGCIGLASVTIPNSVTSIGKSAFDGCTGLTSINITDIAAWCRMKFYNSTVNNSYYTSNPLSIAHHLYLNGSEVIDLVIPDSVNSIGRDAFYGCTGMASVTFPNSVTTIGERAFSVCGLTSVNIGSSVNFIGDYAFSGCRRLTSVSIPNSIITINDYVFKDCIGLINVKLPKTLKSIANYVFQGCTGLTCITIPESVTTIGNYAFSGCKALTNVTIPNSVTSIGNYAFQGCTGLTSATIKSYLTSIGSYAFSNCSALTTFTCMPETPPILDNSNSFNTYSTTSLHVPRSGVENYKTHANWRRFAKIYEFVGYFTVPDVNVSKGKTVVIPVSMTNEADIIGFQTDIYLPEGFEFVKDGNDYVVDPSDRLARDHSIMCNVSEDGALRVLCYSPTNKVISGNEGELFYVTIKAPNDTVGDFSLWFKNTILTTSDTEELLSPDASTNLNVIPYLPGDVNGNGEVSVIDIVTAAQYIIFENPDPFLFEAADLNNDEQITVTDLALIANLILYPTMNAPKRVPFIVFSEDQIHGNDIHLSAGETRTISISLDNVEKYSAFQMDLKLPSGLTASNFKMTNQTDRHSFITSEEKDGMIRVLCYSPSLTSLGNEDKSLLIFDVTSSGSIVIGDIIIDGIELVTTTCNPVHLDALTISVNQTSAVNEISNGKSVAHIDYYNLAGQKLTEPAKGVSIIVTTYNDGSRSAQKVIM